MSKWTRRAFIGAAGATAACSATGISRNKSSIDASVAQARRELFNAVPGTEALASRAAGVLIMPEVTKAGLMVGGAYGEGALMIGNATVDYFSFSGASFGLQIGVQKYSHALFFMTPEVLANFRYADGWELGVDAEYALQEDGMSVGVTTGTINLPVYAVVFSQRGLIIGATLEGAKYSRLIR